ncbi:MAG: hypothetical protein OEZ65_12130 [Gemmatimonadota bacterium]|nr:hypothetical protein [Gemmatimonadota bacterium]MDH5760329.1 hypothetical protein [Gemmatimonadota bacterium]
MKRIALVLALVAATVSPLTGQESVARDAPEQDTLFVNLPAATDSTYGHSPDNPIRVGMAKGAPMGRHQYRFMDHLRGPNGEAVEWERRGSCCGYDTPNGIMGRGLLDVYEVTYRGLDEPIVLYLTFYDYEDPRIPAGFTGTKR